MDRAKSLQLLLSVVRIWQLECEINEFNVWSVPHLFNVEPRHSVCRVEVIELRPELSFRMVSSEDNRNEESGLSLIRLVGTEPS